MGHIAATPFGIGSPSFNPLQQAGFGFSPYGSSLLQPVLQLLQGVNQHLQQLQQLNYVQQQQLQQLQQWIQIVPQQIQQLHMQQSGLSSPAQGLTGFGAPNIGASPLYVGQPGQVM